MKHATKPPTKYCAKKNAVDLRSFDESGPIWMDLAVLNKNADPA